MCMWLKESQGREQNNKANIVKKKLVCEKFIGILYIILETFLKTLLKLGKN